MELTEFLNELDLTSYEKQAIIFLSRVNQATATQIHKATKIPQGRIYSVLNDLKDKKILTIIPKNPKIYKIEDIKKALKKFLEKKKRKIEKKESEIKNITEKPRKIIFKKGSSTNIFIGREEHMEGISHLYSITKKEILRIAPLFRGDFATRFNMKKAKDRGIKIKIIIMNINKENKRNIKEYLEEGIEIRLTNSKDVLSYSLSDQEEFLLGTENYQKDEERFVIHSKNKEMAKLLYKNFQEIWSNSKKVSLKDL